MLGTNPLLWCCPNVHPLGTGLKYQLAESEGKWVELSARELEPRGPEHHEDTFPHV
jgi:palmitoyltransferase